MSFGEDDLYPENYSSGEEAVKETEFTVDGKCHQKPQTKKNDGSLTVQDPMHDMRNQTHFGDRLITSEDDEDENLPFDAVQMNNVKPHVYNEQEDDEEEEEEEDDEDEEDEEDEEEEEEEEEEDDEEEEEDDEEEEEEDEEEEEEEEEEKADDKAIEYRVQTAAPATTQYIKAKENAPPVATPEGFRYSEPEQHGMQAYVDDSKTTTIVTSQTEVPAYLNNIISTTTPQQVTKTSTTTTTTSPPLLRSTTPIGSLAAIAAMNNNPSLKNSAILLEASKNAKGQGAMPYRVISSTEVSNQPRTTYIGTPAIVSTIGQKMNVASNQDYEASQISTTAKFDNNLLKTPKESNFTKATCEEEKDQNMLENPEQFYKNLNEEPADFAQNLKSKLGIKQKRWGCGC